MQAPNCPMTTWRVAGIFSGMSKIDTPSVFKTEFIARTKLAREATGMTQTEIAMALGVDQGRYKQYETRSLLPHEMIGRFCAITRVTEKWLTTGVGAAPARPMPPIRPLDRAS